VNQAGDARCDEKTSRMLADTSSLLMKRYHGRVTQAARSGGT
jgi:hypothetical protein